MSCRTDLKARQQAMREAAALILESQPGIARRYFAERIQIEAGLDPEFLDVLRDKVRKDQRGRFLHHHKGRPRRRG